MVDWLVMQRDIAFQWSLYSSLFHSYYYDCVLIVNYIKSQKPFDVPWHIEYMCVFMLMFN
jgi:hypothetical protein